MKLLFLGTGTSYGVPLLDCMLNDYATCPQNVCQLAAHDPKLNRTRSSLLVTVNHKQILVDVSPDFRVQMLIHRVKQIDAVLITHSHADHIQGLSDIRPYCSDETQPLDLYGSRETVEEIRKRFHYMFDAGEIIGGGVPNVRLHVKENQENFDLFGVPITPALVQHGSLKECYGYRIGNVGYVPDVKVMPPETKAVFRDLDLLILNMLRRFPDHPSHLTLEVSVALAQELRPKRCYFTHFNHDIHYQKDRHRLPANMAFAYDGLVVDS